MATRKSGNGAVQRAASGFRRAAPKALWPLLGALCLAPMAMSCGETLRRTNSNDIFVEPNNLVFANKRVGETEVKVIEIRQGGETELTVKEIYLIPRPELLEGETPDDLPEKACDSTDTTYLECDRVKLDLVGNEPLPAHLDMVCQYVIQQRSELPVTMGSDEFNVVDLQYRPTGAGTPGPAMLVVKSDARDKECQLVDIQVQSAAPRISATETTIGFQGGQVGQDATLFIKNIGSGDLTVQPYTLALQTPPATDPVTGDPVPEFRIETLTDFPWFIAPNDSESITIYYEPVDDTTDKAVLSFQSNDPESPVISITLTSEPIFGILDVSPSPVIFGVPAAGGTVQKVVTFSNSGLKRIDVLDITLSNDDYTFGGQQTSFQIAGGASRELTVTYQPQTAAGSDATMVIDSTADNSDADGNITIQLTPDGEALPPLLMVDPPALDFSDVAAGASRTATLTLTNPGAAALEVSSIALSGPDGVPPTDPEFELTAGGGATSIAPNESHEVEVTFTRPDGPGQVHVGALVIESNAASSPDVVYFTANAPSE